MAIRKHAEHYVHLVLREPKLLLTIVVGKLAGLLIMLPAFLSFSYTALYQYLQVALLENGISAIFVCNHDFMFYQAWMPLLARLRFSSFGTMFAGLVLFYVLGFVMYLYQITLVDMSNDMLQRVPVDITRSVGFAKSKAKVVAQWMLLMSAFFIGLRYLYTTMPTSCMPNALALATFLVFIFSSYVITFESSDIVRIAVRSGELLICRFGHVVGLIFSFMLATTLIMAYPLVYIGSVLALSANMMYVLAAIVHAILISFYVVALTHTYRRACEVSGKKK